MPAYKSCLAIGLSLLLPSLQARNGSATPRQQSSAPNSAAVAPELFSPGVISGPANDGSPTFAPDGNTLFFTRSTAAWSAIVESHRVAGEWSQPQLASFSGEYSDSSPGMAPDGSYLVFVSLRPQNGGAETSAQNPRVANLWRVNRQGPGWSKPARLPDTVNIGHSVWKPSIALDGTIYFVSINEKGQKRLFASQFRDGQYQQAQPLSFSDGESSDVDPEIAPDGSFLVFCSSGRRKDDSKDHLFFVKRIGADWGPVQPMRYAGDTGAGNSTDDEPHLAPDHRTVYFSSDRGMPVKFPRSREQAVADLKRLEIWDNSNSNVWFMPIDIWLAANPGT